MPIRLATFRRVILCWLPASRNSFKKFPHIIIEWLFISASSTLKDSSIARKNQCTSSLLITDCCMTARGIVCRQIIHQYWRRMAASIERMLSLMYPYFQWVFAPLIVNAWRQDIHNFINSVDVIRWIFTQTILLTLVGRVLFDMLVLGNNKPLHCFQDG